MKKIWIIIVLPLLFSACKEEDYREKWCEDYNFVYYTKTWTFPGTTSNDTINTIGCVYYTKEMEENQLFIQNGIGYELGLIPIDTFGVINLPKIDRGIQIGYFINKDTLYYSYNHSSGQAHEYSFRMFGYKKK